MVDVNYFFAPRCLSQVSYPEFVVADHRAELDAGGVARVPRPAHIQGRRPAHVILGPPPPLRPTRRGGRRQRTLGNLLG
ncbi:MAG: hypothetical protein J7M25_00610, partial [Deltaproteobacteria bacterium]|nr:hypothetical protein [Deltaproteobacteria bacterium]